MLALAKEKNRWIWCSWPRTTPWPPAWWTSSRPRAFPASAPTPPPPRSKPARVFSKDLMRKYHIPTAGYQVLRGSQAAPGIHPGPGKVPGGHQGRRPGPGQGAWSSPKTRRRPRGPSTPLWRTRFSGSPGAQVVVEEFLTGPEVSVLAFTDGKTLKPMVSSMDHKRAYDGDKGPNTGGMGTISPNPFYTEEVAQECMEQIFLPTVKAMNAEGRPFKGCLYFGLMLTPQGPKVIEYNSRFGDPETQGGAPPPEDGPSPRSWRPWLRSAFRSSPSSGTKRPAPAWSWPAAATPAAIPRASRSTALEEDGQAQGVTVYHAGTKLEGGRFLTNGGRVLGGHRPGKHPGRSPGQGLRRGGAHLL